MLILNRKFKKLKNLLIFSFAFFIILPTLGLGLIVFFSSETIISKKIADNTINSVEQTNLSIEKEAKNLENYIDYFIMNDKVQTILTKTNFKQYDHELRNAYLELDNIINNDLVTNSIKNRVNILLISPKEGFYRYNEAIYLDENEIRNSIWYSDTIKMMGKINWIGMERSKSIINSSGYVFNVSRAILSKGSFKVIGVIYLSVNESVFEPVFQKASSNQSVYVINQNGDIILSSDRKTLGTEFENASSIVSYDRQPGSFNIKIDGKEFLYVYSSPNKYGWRVINRIPVNMLTGEIDRIKVLTFGTLILCIGISVYFLIAIFKDITKPLHYLINFINEIESGNKSIELEKFPCYELIKLSNGVVSLIEKNKSTTKKLQNTEKLYHKTHLEKLEAQVNPHFLYNTLNSIKYIALENKQETIGNLITSFTKLLRNCINTGENLIEVKEEIENLKHYILIQNVTYKNSIQFIFEIDNKLNNYLIPRFLLQPMVENSIIHGINRNSEENVITIRGYTEGEKLFFEVEDNGKGMDQNIIDRVLNNEGDKDTFTRFGIKGVKERLTLLYGADYDLKIESVVNLGTRIVIKLPVLTKEKIKEQIKQ